MANWIGTSVNLGASETKELGTMQVGSQDRLLGLVRCSHAVTLHLFQSIDGGRNWDKDDTIAVGANTTVEIDENPIFGNTIRVQVVGNASATTYFRLGVKLTSAGPRP